MARECLGVCRESFNDWGGRGCRKFVPVLGGDGAKTAPPGDIFDQPPGKLSSIWGKLTDHVEDHAVLSSEGVVSVTTPGTESTYPHPPQSLNDSRLLNLTNVEDSGCTSLRVHLGSLLASGPALALVLHLPVKCGSRTLDPGISLPNRFARKRGLCKLGSTRGRACMTCMTAACLKTLALICLTKLFW